MARQGRAGDKFKLAVAQEATDAANKSANLWGQYMHIYSSEKHFFYGKSANKQIRKCGTRECWG